MAIVRLRRDIGARRSREPLYCMMSLQAGFAQPALVDAAERHPITHDNIIHDALPFPLLCARKIEDDRTVPKSRAQA
jgi:hypothetical protein